MNARDCRKKANEFLLTADSITDDLDSRLGWLLLCNVWFSLADQIEQHAASAQQDDNEADQQAEREPLAPLNPTIKPAEKPTERPDVMTAELGDLLRGRLALQ
jgi:hypothetical protein